MHDTVVIVVTSHPVVLIVPEQRWKDKLFYFTFVANKFENIS